MGLRVIRPGTFATVQDGGRPGFRHWGVPTGGAFDAESAALANALLGNPPEAAVLELTQVGGTYEAEHALALALAGAPMVARVDGPDGPSRPIGVPSSFGLSARGRLTLGPSPIGVRCYLAVRGGWQTPTVLGSRSRETWLVAGELLPAGTGTTATRRVADAPMRVPAARPLRLVEGPDPFDLGSLTGQVYRVSPRSDRMGVRLAGVPVGDPGDPNRVSAPVAPGAVQLAGGLPIVLGVAGGTLGGYPHVAHLIAADLPALAQARPGDAVRFERVSLAEARQLGREARQSWQRLCLRVATAARDGWAD